MSGWTVGNVDSKTARIEIYKRYEIKICKKTKYDFNLPFIELLSAEFGMLMGAEDLVIRLLLAKLADKELSRCSSMEQAAVWKQKHTFSNIGNIFFFAT